MKFFKEILLAFQSYLEGLKYFPNFYKSFLLLILLILIFSTPIVFIDFAFKSLLSHIPFFHLIKYEKLLIQMMANFSGFLLLLILSPVFSLVSEKLMHILAGKTYRFSPAQLIKDIIRGIKITMRNLVYEYFYVFVITLILWILPENPIISIVGLLSNILVVSYFYGFSLLDYALENYRIGYNPSVKFVRSHSGIAVGLGLLYTLLIHFNDKFFHTDNHWTIYWTAFGEALIAFAGVIAASIIMFKKRQIIQ